LSEIAERYRRPYSQKRAESNIPEGMVPRVFCGRDEALSEIEKAFAGSSGIGTTPSVIALHGLRGVGKSALAAAYAELHTTDYRAAWWIRAEAEAGLRSGLIGLAIRLGWVMPDQEEEEALSTARERLRQEGDQILLIFDNAHDVASLRPWLLRGCRSEI